METERDYSQSRRMLLDAARFVPSIGDSQYASSFFVDKVVLTKSESTDSRPIFVSKSGASKRYFSVLGAKIDNVYDALEFFESDRDLSDCLKAKR